MLSFVCWIHFPKLENYILELFPCQSTWSVRMAVSYLAAWKSSNALNSNENSSEVKCHTNTLYDAMKFLEKTFPEMPFSGNYFPE